MLFPPAITVEEVTPETETRISVSLLFFPGILLMALLLSAQGLSAEYWQERDDGTLARLASSPQPMSAYVTAKFLAASVLFAGVSFVMLAAGFAYHGIAISRFPLSAVMLVLSGVALYAFLSLIQLFAPNRKGASLLNTLLVYPLMMVGGSFFPFEAMPDWLAAIGRFSPNGALLEELKRYLLGRQGAAALLASIGTVAVVVVALHVAVTFRLRSVVRG
jgi:ABC-type multidrug transport system permease subunit